MLLIGGDWSNCVRDAARQTTTAINPIRIVTCAVAGQMGAAEAGRSG
jgi:hypothetical protein